jgi:hypothetical protein
LKAISNEITKENKVLKDTKDSTKDGDAIKAESNAAISYFNTRKNEIQEEYNDILAQFTEKRKARDVANSQQSKRNKLDQEQTILNIDQ